MLRTSMDRLFEAQPHDRLATGCKKGRRIGVLAHICAPLGETLSPVLHQMDIDGAPESLLQRIWRLTESRRNILYEMIECRLEGALKLCPDKFGNGSACHGGTLLSLTPFSNFINLGNRSVYTRRRSPAIRSHLLDNPKDVRVSGSTRLRQLIPSEAYSNDWKCDREP